MRAATPMPGTGAAPAALARPDQAGAVMLRLLVVDDSDEAAPRIVCLIADRSLPTHSTEVHS